MTDAPATETPTWDELDLTEREGFIRRPLVVIRKAWPLEAPAPVGSGSRTLPASRIPTNVDALTVRAEITHDLAFWCRALLEDHPEGVGTTQRLDLHDVPAMVEHLIREARWAAGWAMGWEMQSYLADLARDAALVAWPRDRDSIYLGDCPNTIGADGEVVTCGAPVRATAKAPGDVKCPGCSLSDTIDGWILRIVGDEPLVTAEQLVPILHKRLGVVVTPKGVQTWKNRGKIRVRAVDDAGRNLYDRQEVMTFLTHREAI